jgi:hypothetical protein
VGDKVCVYDLGKRELNSAQTSTIPSPHQGCVVVAETGDQLKVDKVPDRRPDLLITPVTSTSLQLQVSLAPTDEHWSELQAMLFSTSGNFVTSTKLLPLQSGMFSGTLTSLKERPALAGHVRVWGRRPGKDVEIAVADYALGGRPVNATSNAGDVTLRRREAPASSADGQVVMYLDGPDLKLGQILTLQAVTNLPDNIPPWISVIGQPYRLSATEGVDLQNRLSVAFNYLNREVPPGEKQWVKVYFYNYISKTWALLPTTSSTSLNVASAVAPGRGLYVLASSIEIPLKTGWNLVAYPVNETRPIREALASIDGRYTDVYTYDPNDPKGPFLYFKPNLADSDPRNTLKVLKPYYGYWIKTTQPATLYLKGSTTAPGAAASARMVNVPPGMSTLPPPPASFHGEVLGGAGFAPAAGMTVTARLDGRVCGQGRTALDGERVVYSIYVHADSPIAPGCGKPGRLVTFQVGQAAIATTTRWDSDQPHELVLRPE